MHLKYRFNFRSSMVLVVTCLTIVSYTNCDGRFQATQAESEQMSSMLSENCGTPSNQSPQTIDQAIEMINALPKPLSVACFVSHLKKPLAVFAVDNQFSAQPSMGPENPRIFIMNGNLIISVVPKGPSSEVIEFSQITAPDISVKGEVAFPVIDTLPASEPYSKIKEGLANTSCRICHNPESRDFTITTGEAYQSKILEPDPFHRIRQRDLYATSINCNPQIDLKRCQILEAIFINGRAQDQNFPTSPR